MKDTSGRPLGGSRRIGAKLFALAVVSWQLAMVVRAYRDPHVHFGYQPFNESSVWQADVFAVDRRGKRHDIRHGWAGYRWEDLVRDRVGHPFSLGHADSGVDSTLFFLQSALDWVADNTPRDRETSYLEAHITYYRNRHGPTHRIFRSKLRRTALDP